MVKGENVVSRLMFKNLSCMIRDVTLCNVSCNLIVFQSQRMLGSVSKYRGYVSLTVILCDKLLKNVLQQIIVKSTTYFSTSCTSSCNKKLHDFMIVKHVSSDLYLTKFQVVRQVAQCNGILNASKIFTLFEQLSCSLPE